MDRAFQFPQSPWPRTCIIPITFVGQGSGKAPTLGTGDPNATYFQQPVFTSTGIWTVTTVDPYPVNAVAAVSLGIMQATGAGTLTAQISPIPAQNTTASAGFPLNSYTFTFNTFVSGSAADILTGDRLYAVFCLINTSPGFGSGTTPTD